MISLFDNIRFILDDLILRSDNTIISYWTMRDENTIFAYFNRQDIKDVSEILDNNKIEYKIDRGYILYIKTEDVLNYKSNLRNDKINSILNE